MELEELIELTVFELIRKKLVQLGWLPDINGYNIESLVDSVAIAAAESFRADKASIANSKGFCIEVFPFSSNQAKGFKKVPRIVIDSLQFLPSMLGNDTKAFYELSGEKYVLKQAESTLSDFSFNIYIVGNTAEQIRVMNHILMSVLPKRGYIKRYNEDFKASGNFYVKLLDAQKSEDLPEGIIERVFRYEIPEVSELEPTIISSYDIAKIQSIQLLIETFDKNSSSLTIE